MEFGIIEAKKLVVATASVANIAGKVFEDGKVSTSDVAYVFSLLEVLKQFNAVDFSKVVPELSNVSPAEYQALAAELVKSFDIPQNELEAKIEKIVVSVGQVYAAVIPFIELVKGLKK